MCTNLTETTDPNDPLWWKDIPKEYKYVTRGATGEYKLFVTKPQAGALFWRALNSSGTPCPKDVFIRTKDWSEAIVERPMDYSECIGKLCFFSNDEIDEVTSTGPVMLTEYKPTMTRPFRTEDGAWWENCTPVTKEQILKYLYE